MSAEGPGPITALLAERLVELSRSGAVVDLHVHAESHIANALALAVSASGHPAVEAVVRMARDFEGGGATPLPGRSERLDLLRAPVAIGVAAHIEDFDDTHLETMIHPSAATLAAAWTAAVHLGSTGSSLLAAFVLGCEAQLRVGMALGQSHYDSGWHITGTCGVIGAAVASAILLDLDPSRLSQALGIAASSTVGQREGFGTMLKPFHPGKAAANGLLAARLAAAGFSGSQRVLEAPRGMLAVLSDDPDPTQVTADLGYRWEFLRDMIKPYPCGVVLHPAIDAAVELHARAVRPEDVASVVVRCHPLVADLTNIAAPTTALEARFSVTHAVACALADGAVDQGSFGEEQIRRPEVARLRAGVQVRPDPDLARDEVELIAELDGGGQERSHIRHARGSQDRPLSSNEVEDKIRRLCRGTLPDGGDALLVGCSNLAQAPDLQELVDAVAPSPRR